MTDTRAALAQALDALREATTYTGSEAWSPSMTRECEAAITAAEAALAAPTLDDAGLWAEIYRLRAAVQGPDGYATWQDAATAERVRRVKAEAALAGALRALWRGA